MNQIYISGYFSDEDYSTLDEIKEELNKANIQLHCRNLSGTIMHSALDFIDIDMVEFGWDFIQAMIFSGSFELLKLIVKKLWKLITKDRNTPIPFTVSISGIPSITGTENIKCKISGLLSDEAKEIAIHKGFELASQVEKHQFELLEKDIYYPAFNAHLFRYDPERETYDEIDIAAEVKKKQSSES